MSARFYQGNYQPDPSENWSPETLRLARKILEQARRHRLGKQMDLKNPNMLLCAELIDSGHLEGWITLETNGQPRSINDISITLLGLEYLDNFENEIACSHAPFRKHFGWLTKGFVILILFGALLVLLPENDTRAEKPDTETNAVSTVKLRVSNFPADSVVPSDSSGLIFSTTANDKWFFPVVCVKCTQVE